MQDTPSMYAPWRAGSRVTPLHNWRLDFGVKPDAFYHREEPLVLSPHDIAGHEAHLRRIIDERPRGTALGVLCSEAFRGDYRPRVYFTGYEWRLVASLPKAVMPDSMLAAMREQLAPHGWIVPR